MLYSIYHNYGIKITLKSHFCRKNIIIVSLLCTQRCYWRHKTFPENRLTISTGGKPRNYHEIVLTQFCSQATSGTRRGSFQAEN